MLVLAMPVIAITGGIGSGKSAVRRIFEELGAAGVDADDLARTVVKPGTIGWVQIREVFGEEFFDSKGRLDRAQLAEVVFADPAARKSLESILHPLILEAEARLVEEALAEKPERPVVVEIPLLVEGGEVDRYDGTVLVTASRITRLERLERAGILRRKEAEARIQSQASEEERARIADWIIDNEGPIENTRNQVERILHDLIPGKDRKKGKKGECRT